MPTVYSKDEIEKLLNVVDKCTAKGLRDYVSKARRIVIPNECADLLKVHFKQAGLNNGNKNRHVYDFNTPRTINALGIASSDIAEMGLREISRTVIQAQRDQFFANRKKSGYDGRTEQHETPHERSEQHGGY